MCQRIHLIWAIGSIVLLHASVLLVGVQVGNYVTGPSCYALTLNGTMMIEGNATTVRYFEPGQSCQVSVSGLLITIACYFIGLSCVVQAVMWWLRQQRETSRPSWSEPVESLAGERSRDGWQDRPSSLALPMPGATPLYAQGPVYGQPSTRVTPLPHVLTE